MKKRPSISSFFISLKQAPKDNFLNAGIICFIGTTIGNFGNYLFHLIIGRLLGPSDYGAFVSIISLVGLLGIPLSTLGFVLIKFVSSFSAINRRGEELKLFYWVNKWALVIGIFLGITLLFFSATITKFLNYDSLWAVPLAVLIFFVNIFLTINRAFLQGNINFLKLSLSGVIEITCKLIIGIAAVLLGFSYPGVVLSIFLSLLLAYFFTLPYKLVKKIKQKNIEINLKKISYFSIPTFIISSSFISLITIDVILVKHFFDPVQAGIYGALSTLGKIIFFASGPVVQILFPFSAREKARNRNPFPVFLKGLVGTLFITFAITSIYIIFPNLAVSLLFGKKFIEVSQYLWIFSLFMVIYTYSYTAANFLLAIGETKISVIIALSAILQPILIFLFHHTLLEIILASIIPTFVLTIYLTIYVFNQLPSFLSNLPFYFQKISYEFTKILLPFYRSVFPVRNSIRQKKEKIFEKIPNKFISFLKKTKKNTPEGLRPKKQAICFFSNLKKSNYREFFVFQKKYHKIFPETVYPTSNDEYLFSQIANFKKKDSVFLGIANLDVLNLATHINPKIIIFVDINYSQLDYLNFIIYLIRKNKTRADFISSFFNKETVSVNKLIEGNFSKMAPSEIENLFWNLPDQKHCKDKKWFSILKDYRVEKDSSGKNIGISYSKLGNKVFGKLKIITTLISNDKKNFDAGEQNLDIFPLIKKDGFLWSEENYKTLKAQLIKTPIVMINESITSCFDTLLSNFQYELQIYWLSNLFGTWEFFNKDVSVFSKKILKLIYSPINNYHLVFVEDKRNPYLPTTSRNPSAHWLALNMVNRYINGKCKEVVTVPNWAKRQFSSLPFTRYLMLQDFLNSNRTEECIFFHILLGNGVNKENFRLAATKALEKARRLIILEHNKKSSEFSSDIGIDKKEITEILGKPNFFSAIPGNSSKNRNLIFVYDKTN